MTPIKLFILFIQLLTEAVNNTGSGLQPDQQWLVVTHHMLAAERNMWWACWSYHTPVTLMYVVSFTYIIITQLFSSFRDLWLCICCLPVCTFSDSAVYSEPFYSKQRTLMIRPHMVTESFYKHTFRNIYPSNNPNKFLFYSVPTSTGSGSRVWFLRRGFTTATLNDCGT